MRWPVLVEELVRSQESGQACHGSCWYQLYPPNGLLYGEMDRGVGTRAKKWTVCYRGTRKRGLKEAGGHEGGWNGLGSERKGSQGRLSVTGLCGAARASVS